MFTVIDVEAWERKDQYYYFRDFDNPFFNVCVDVDVSRLHGYAKAQQLSFFVASLYLSLKAANLVREMRYRLRGGDVIEYEQIHAGSTVLNEGGGFSFCYFDYCQQFGAFNSKANALLTQHRRQRPGLDPKLDADNLIHHSVVPWLAFSSISHARKFRKDDAIPKIVFGKYTEQNAEWRMPLSVEVHHALMDGYHVANYVACFQDLLNDPEQHLALD